MAEFREQDNPLGYLAFAASATRLPVVAEDALATGATAAVREWCRRNLDGDWWVGTLADTVGNAAAVYVTAAADAEKVRAAFAPAVEPERRADPDLEAALRGDADAALRHLARLGC